MSPSCWVCVRERHCSACVCIQSVSSQWVCLLVCMCDFVSVCRVSECVLSHWSRLWPRLSSPCSEAPAACCALLPANNAADVTRPCSKHTHTHINTCTYIIHHLTLSCFQICTWTHTQAHYMFTRSLFNPPHTDAYTDTYRHTSSTYTHICFASYSAMFDLTINIKNSVTWDVSSFPP